VTEVVMRGLSCAEHAVANNNERAKAFRSCMANTSIRLESS
jgi:hypothetical protein